MSRRSMHRLLRAEQKAKRMAKEKKSRLKELLKAQQLARAGILSAPASFLAASPEYLLSICNGCGAAGSWFRPPKRIWGTLIVYACHIHDWMYGAGKCIEDKDEADRTMRNNMHRLFERDRGKWYKPTKLQYIRANIYYQAVRKYGGSAFWKGKS